MRAAASLVALLLLVAAFALPAAAAPAREIVFVVGQKSYIVDGRAAPMDAAPFVVGGRAYVPVRYLAYALGVPESGVSWSPSARTVTLRKDGITVSLAAGGTVMHVNGRPQKMDMPALIKDGRVFMPARFVAEAFGYRVGWDPSMRAVVIEKPASVSRGGGAPGRSARVVVDPGHGGRDPGAVAGSLREAGPAGGDRTGGNSRGGRAASSDGQRAVVSVLDSGGSSRLIGRHSGRASPDRRRFVVRPPRLGSSAEGQDIGPLSLVGYCLVSGEPPRRQLVP